MKFKIPKEEIEKIRTTCTSPEHLIQCITSLVEGYTEYTISFYSYPCVFDVSVSNSHSCPKGYEQNWGRNSDRPLGYPGWRGSWQGNITRKDGSKATATIRDLCTSMPFLKTGTGTSGANFHIEGNLFLYDFPMMHDLATHNDSIESKVAMDEYRKTALAYVTKYESRQKRYIEQHDLYKKIDSFQTEMKTILNTLEKAELLTRQAAIDEFNTKYAVDLPTPPLPAVMDTKVATYHAKCCHIGATVFPDLEHTFSRIEQITEDFKTFSKEHPELLL